MTWRVAAGATVLALLALPPMAFGRDRLAVIIAVDDDRAGATRALSDNLTEIAISELAEGPDRELVGTQELRPLLGEASETGGLVGCLARPECLVHLGELAGVSRAVIGSVHRQAGSYALALDLVETRTATRQSEVSRSVPLDLTTLIAAIRKGVAALLPARESGTTDLPAPPGATRVRDGSAPVGATPSPPPTSKSFPPTAATTPLPPIVSITGYGAAGLAVVAFSASAVLGAIADEPPSGPTRAQKEMDLFRRAQDADRATAFLIIGTLLTTVAGAALIWHLRH